mmetsp:Transcript_16395/g.45260  ORF Transcript_16395/g.45260 Transcript_16395/m.45260 type:complete len:238 (-) Transcript_16395:1071-1784(-)
MQHRDVGSVSRPRRGAGTKGPFGSGANDRGQFQCQCQLQRHCKRQLSLGGGGGSVHSGITIGSVAGTRTGLDGGTRTGQGHGTDGYCCCCCCSGADGNRIDGVLLVHADGGRSPRLAGSRCGGTATGGGHRGPLPIHWQSRTRSDPPPDGPQHVRQGRGNRARMGARDPGRVPGGVLPVRNHRGRPGVAHGAGGKDPHHLCGRRGRQELRRESGRPVVRQAAAPGGLPAARGRANNQ